MLRTPQWVQVKSGQRMVSDAFVSLKNHAAVTCIVAQRSGVSQKQSQYSFKLAKEVHVPHPARDGIMLNTSD